MVKSPTISRTNGTADPLPPDHAERQRILHELDTTMLVEAAAGTGKTTSMVGRMVALLRAGKCRIDTLAAVTFTRKSTAELRARFQIELERAVATETGSEGKRLAEALLHIERCFIGTIHSFCARLLRERPLEAGVDLSFTELDEADDVAIREEAWNEYVAQLYAENSDLLMTLTDLGMEVGQLQNAFLRIAAYPDVDEWPAPEIELPDLEPVWNQIVEFVQHMEELVPTFPFNRGNDELMNRYELIPRLMRQTNPLRPAEIMDLLGQFRKVTVVQKHWPGGAVQGKLEKNRWEDFVTETAEPRWNVWLERRYAAVIRTILPAMAVYNRRRHEAGGLNFQDLLLRAAALLRNGPAIRRYFHARFTHLLVDEFQDTDPIQAEVLLLLTADNPAEQDWRSCRPKPGSLFVVGDPKQSIYRFRRADIVIFTQVKEIMLAAGGTVVPLTTNFRTISELVHWGNSVFDQTFPSMADTWSPAACPMQVGRDSLSDGQLKGVYVLRVPDTHGRSEQAVEYESDFVARTIRQAIDAGLTLPRTPAELARGVTPTAQPGDFLIVTRAKKHLALYARKLGELGVPHQVTGGSALGQVAELELLSKCLIAVAEPDNPVALVAVLRSELFGVSDAVLYSFRKAGGRFDFRTEVPTTLHAESGAPLHDAFARLKRYQHWFRQLPTIAALERMAVDLGLPMRAASNVDGNVRAGSLAKAFEVLRAAQTEVHSTADLAEYLVRLIEENREFDGLTARPHEAPAVRLMNLHKVKGLEATVVFLADPTGEYDHNVELHVDRSGNSVRGYMVVYGTASGFQKPLLARPGNSDALFAAERRFQNAENHRLMYVAATRAGAVLAIVQRDQGNKQNPWSFFQSHLAATGIEGIRELPDPGPQSRPVLNEVVISDLEVTNALDALSSRWEQAAKASYATAAAKRLSLTPSRPHFHGASAEYGTEWGTVIHFLLESAMMRPDADLHQLACMALADEGLDVSYATESVKIVTQVLQSDVLSRARTASRYLVEVPFQKLLPATSPRAVEGLPTILRGVIDLTFLEPSGWVIVDYKTDRIPEGRVSAFVEHYRPQVETYAEVWQEMIGQPVRERGLYFTHLDKYVPL